MNHLLESLINKAKKDPSPRVFFRICEEYRKSGDHQKVIEFGEQGLELEHDHVPTLLTVGKSYLHLEKFEEAMDFFQRALDKDPDNIRATHALAACLINTGRGDEAERYVNNLHILQPALEEEIKKEIESVRNQDTLNEVEGENSISLNPEAAELNKINRDSPSGEQQIVSTKERKLLKLNKFLSDIRRQISV
ncbi:MAG: hypothetical protein CSA81_06835 [Acidobacteria bacterium]|nr:MAG: hypothetical protein CSA81_06835 [Acidobacteriota bacterium]